MKTIQVVAMNFTKALTICVLSALPAIAANAKGDLYITPYGGAYDVFDERHRKAMGGLDLRFENFIQYFTPKAGAYVTAKGGNYIYGGFNFVIPVYSDKIRVMPGISVGHHDHRKCKKLGGRIEFRSSIEINYQMDNKHRVGVALAHISNASIYKKNPGAEDLVLTYGIPFSIF